MTQNKKPTIYQALKTSLKREPTNRELNNEVRRILGKQSVEEEMQDLIDFSNRGLSCQSDTPIA